MSATLGTPVLDSALSTVAQITCGAMSSWIVTYRPATGGGWTSVALVPGLVRKPSNMGSVEGPSIYCAATGDIMDVRTSWAVSIYPETKIRKVHAVERDGRFLVAVHLGFDGIN